MIYDVNGNVIAVGGQSNFTENMELDYAYDAATNVNYTVLRIFQTKRDGTKQYPFVRCPGFKKIAAFMDSEGWEVAINAGLGWSNAIDGVAVENGVVKNNTPANHHAGSIPLTIDANGNLGTAAANATGTSLVSNGFVSAVCGFCPIIENYVPNATFPTVSNVTHFGDNAQRTIIGQFGNGDYALITCAGRSNDNSDGWKLTEAQTVCQRLGLKFAYNLDGGASTSMYLRKHPVYDFMAGVTRIVPSFIVFNGSSTFSIPAASA